MKKLILFFVLVSISVMSFAQLTLGAHFAYNSTWLMNKQVFDEGPEMDIASSFGTYYGIIAGYYFSDNFGVEINFNPNKIEQKYVGSIKYFFNDDRNSYDASTVIKTLDIPILMKFGKNSYFELGPLVQLINKATYSRTFENENAWGYYNILSHYDCSNYVDKAVKSDFKGTGIGITMGFGANFNIVEDVLKLNFGLRFNYILSNIEGINALGETVDSEFVPDADKANFYNNPLYGGLKVGLIYIFD
jgi:hypothetical protein